MRKIILIQPSSAAAERVFSLLKASFNERQDGSLQDYIESSLMLQYNKREVVTLTSILMLVKNSFLDINFNRSIKKHEHIGLFMEHNGLFCEHNRNIL